MAQSHCIDYINHSFQRHQRHLSLYLFISNPDVPLSWQLWFFMLQDASSGSVAHLEFGPRFETGGHRYFEISLWGLWTIGGHHMYSEYWISGYRSYPEANSRPSLLRAGTIATGTCFKSNRKSWIVTLQKGRIWIFSGTHRFDPQLRDNGRAQIAT